jgi:hypothetical protein
MLDGRPSFVTLAVKTVTVHTVTYFLVGLLAFTALDYRRWFAEPHIKAVMRQPDDPWVMAGPLFQPVRGLLFALAFYPLRGILFDRKDGWLVLWLELVILGIVSPFGAAPGSIEGTIYTIWPLRWHLLGLPEVLLQAFLLSAVLHYWVRHPERKWLSWTLGILLFLALLLPTLGLLTRQDQADTGQAFAKPCGTARVKGYAPGIATAPMILPDGVGLPDVQPAMAAIIRKNSPGFTGSGSGWPEASCPCGEPPMRVSLRTM